MRGDARRVLSHQRSLAAVCSAGGPDQTESAGRVHRVSAGCCPPGKGVKQMAAPVSSNEAPCVSADRRGPGLLVPPLSGTTQAEKSTPSGRNQVIGLHRLSGTRGKNCSHDWTEGITELFAGDYFQTKCPLHCKKFKKMHLQTVPG